MKKKASKMNAGAVGLGVVGATLAGLAAAYFFLGPNAKKHQKHAKAWAIKMKGEIVERLEEAGHVTEPIYHQIVDSVAAEYEKKVKTGKKEVGALAQDLKKHWKNIAKS